eukprot:2667175-Rhodomonas_salina.1
MSESKQTLKHLRRGEERRTGCLPTCKAHALEIKAAKRSGQYKRLCIEQKGLNLPHDRVLRALPEMASHVEGPQEEQGVGSKRVEDLHREIKRIKEKKTPFQHSLKPEMPLLVLDFAKDSLAQYAVSVPGLHSKRVGR